MWLPYSVPHTQPLSIAVLPLTTESGDVSQQYLSDGISEDLITTLTQLSGLRVIGRSSSFQFRDSKEDARSIGAKLGVTHLLEGSVRRSGDLIRVSTFSSTRYSCATGMIRALPLCAGRWDYLRRQKWPSGRLQAWGDLEFIIGGGCFPQLRVLFRRAFGVIDYRRSPRAPGEIF